MIGKLLPRILFLASALTQVLPAENTQPAGTAAPLPACSPVVAAGPLRIGSYNGMFALRRGAGTSVITIANAGTDPVTLDVAATPLIECTSNAVLTQAKTALSALEQQKTLAAGAEANVQLSITGVTETSIAREVLVNGGTPIGSLTVVELDAPLNITLAAEGTSEKPLDYSFGQPVSLAIKNGDPEPYHLRWQFLIDGTGISSDILDLPANGTAHISLKEACRRGSLQSYCHNYSFIDPIHPTVKSGVLELSLLAPGSIPSGLLPVRILPVALTMRRVGPRMSLLFSYGYAAFILLLGGLLSFLGGSVLPMMQRKADLRAQLQDLANRTSSVSVRVDSYVRVLLRLERKRVEAAIAAASPWVPTSGDPLTEVPQLIDTLCKRLTAAERLDELRRKHDQISATSPPSVTDAIDLNLQAAADQLHSAALSAEEYAATNIWLNNAQAALDELDDSAALAKLIAGNLVALRTRIDAFPLEYYSDLKAALPGLFVILDPARDFEDPKNIVRPMFFAIDHAIAAIHLMLDYAMVRVTVPNLSQTSSTASASISQLPANSLVVTPEACADLGANARKRLLDRQCILLELLGTLSWLALREAMLLVQEMREDIYQEDVLAEITKPGQAEIAIDTQRTRPLLPIFFSILFKDSRYNNAAALKRLVCHWSFPDALQELSWKVCHYFTGRERMVAVPPAPAGQSGQAIPPDAVVSDQDQIHRADPLSFFRRRRRLPLRHFVIYAAISGRRAQEPKELPVPPLHTTILLERTGRRDKARFVAEALRFFIAFGVALAGLLSGALDQLSKLDFIPATLAILALGFGANSIKNLLTQPAPPQQAQKAAAPQSPRAIPGGAAGKTT